MGYDNYAQWRLQDRMARTPERAFEMMNTVWAASTKRVGEEVSDMQVVANKDKVVIEPWDYSYYAEKVRKAKYDLDSDEVKQYLQLDKLRDAMFFVAGELFNFEFKPVPEGTVSVFHEDVKVWTVTDKTSGAHVGVWYLDPYTRQGKRSGAWATMYRVYSNVDGKKTSVLCSNNSNFVKPAAGEQLLINWSDANTFFHEFGHALHFLSANVPYRSLNTGGVRDYTEFHSQLLERWLLTDPVIEGYFKHYKTGEPMPKTLVEKIKKAATFNQGFKTTSYLASALMDMYYHTASSPNIDPDSFEKERLQTMGMPKQVTMTHRTPQFYHAFGGEGYSAGYYGYIWADVLTSDAAEVFAKAPGGFYDKETAAKMVKYLFSPRNAIDPAEAYKMFRGGEPDLRYLMRDRGF
jgi:peptidyl-dipeptidase Dcp